MAGSKVYFLRIFSEIVTMVIDLLNFQMQMVNGLLSNFVTYFDVPILSTV